MPKRWVTSDVDAVERAVDVERLQSDQVIASTDLWCWLLLAPTANSEKQNEIQNIRIENKQGNLQIIFYIIYLWVVVVVFFSLDGVLHSDCFEIIEMN